jgi:phage terminase small subunit
VSAAELTPKQQRFVEEYLLSLNGADAVRKAGYKVRRPDQQAHELLRKPEIAKAIQAAKAQRSERTKIDADWLLRRLAAEADADIAAIFNDDGSVRAVSEWPEVFRKGLVAGIESFEEYEGRGDERRPVGMVRKIKLADRTKHLELIGRHIDVGAWRDKVQHDLGEVGPDWRALLRQPEGRS